MNAFRATKLPTAEPPKVNLYEVAFTRLVEQIDSKLFDESHGFRIKSLCDQYRSILKELGVSSADTYRTTSLKLKLEQHYGKLISVIGQSSGSGFICSSSLSLGDALRNLQKLQEDLKIDKDYQTLQRAAKII